VATVLVVGMALLAGCGIYDLRFDPPPPAAGTARAPLDASLSLGEARYWAHGRAVALDAEDLAEIDADFVRAAREAAVVRSVLPHGSATDLYLDVTRRLWMAAPGSARDQAYQVLTLPLAVVVPGFPYPWRFRVRRTFALRARVADETLPLHEWVVDYGATLWGKSYWAPFIWTEPLRAGESEYLVRTLHEALEEDRPIFERVVAAMKRKDPEAARRAVRALGASRPPVTRVP
jgi:hypothetical protein